MKRSIFVLLILVTLVAALTSCVPAAAPAAQPAAQPAAADAAKWCSNLRIVFFPGGPQGGVFANNVYNGAKQAQADLGPKVDYVFSDWDPQKMIQQFKEVGRHQARRHRGHGSPRRRGVRRADRRCREERASSSPARTPTAAKIGRANTRPTASATSAQDLYGAGYVLGNEAVKRFGLKAGDRAMVWGLLSQPTRGERTKGVKEALEKPA